MTPEQKQRMAEGRERARLERQQAPPKEKESPPAPPQSDAVTAVAPPAAPEVKRPQTQVFGLNEQEASAFLRDKHDQQSRKALAAIEQARKDAADIAVTRVNNNPVTQALLADPGNTELLLKFMSELGPSKLVPDRPAPTPWGEKDPGLMRYLADYFPDEFLAKHGNGKSDLAKELTALVRGRLK